jgi:hypothetical protein
VAIGGVAGVAPADVAGALSRFQAKLRAVVAALDAKYHAGRALDVDGLAAVIDLAAWTHGEWIRIHPFANGNGRTARLWANSILMRYGIPPAVRLRPRPDRGYESASASAMAGDWQPTAVMFRTMLRDALTSPAPG